MSAFLSQYLDPELKVDANLYAEQIANEEIARLNKLLAVSQTCVTIPRRLGGDATDDELAADKKRCKRIAHVAEQCIISWGGKVKPNGDVAREAAQVNWSRWWEDHQVILNNRLRYVATWAVKTEGDQKWAKGAIVKLMNELRWLQYALR